MKRALLPVLAALLAAGCDFHLRSARSGVEELQADRIYVDEDRADDIADAVRAQLRDAGVKLTDGEDGAQYVILLSKQSFRRDVLSVSPKTGKAEEYQITLNARLTLKQPRGDTLIDNEPISQVRDFTYDQNAVLGKFNEEETLHGDLARDAADQVLRRVSAVLAKQK